MVKRCRSLFDKIIALLVRFKPVLLGIIGFMVAWPSVYITRYSFPAQDDFDYAAQARALMEQGYSLAGQAFKMTKDLHFTWGGLYSSTFFGYFFSGMVMCDPKKLRIFELCSSIFFFICLILLCYVVTKYIFKLEAKETVTVVTFFTIYMFGIAYFGDFDVFYWFITSVQYLMLLGFFELGLGLYILAFNTDKKWAKVCCISAALIFGFLASGANLCITALNCFWFFVISVYFFFTVSEKTEKRICLIGIVPIIGALINGTAPGNYVRAGGGKGIGDMLLAARSSIRYVFERIEGYIAKPEFWVVFLGLILATLFIPRKKKALGITVRFPAIIGCMLIAVLAGIIFPAMLGYKYDVFCKLVRGQVVLDFSMFSFMVFGVLLVEQWFYDKYGDEGIKRVKTDFTLGAITVMLLLSLQLRDNNWRWIGVSRNYRDISSGRCAEFTDYFLDILNKVEESKDELAVVYVDEEIMQKTIQINPMIAYDTCYDPEKQYQNNAIAHFYNKKGVWVIHKEYVPTEEDLEVAKKYGVEDRLIIPEITNEEDIDAAADDAVGNDK
ncbi:MAG: hypothetical protein KBS96_02355 [Lachnospiraceae bacterium]|nr:hypothetical protein [Candidatus Colinaster scatohippi]